MEDLLILFALGTIWALGVIALGVWIALRLQGWTPWQGRIRLSDKEVVMGGGHRHLNPNHPEREYPAHPGPAHHETVDIHHGEKVAQDAHPDLVAAEKAVSEKTAATASERRRLAEQREGERVVTNPEGQLIPQVETSPDEPQGGPAVDRTAVVEADQLERRAAPAASPSSPDDVTPSDTRPQGVNQERPQPQGPQARPSE